VPDAYLPAPQVTVQSAELSAPAAAVVVPPGQSVQEVAAMGWLDQVPTAQVVHDAEPAALA
jgi:hypothetical protein